MPEFNSALMYILSGTGNTFRMGCWIKDICEKENIPGTIKMVDAANLEKDFHLLNKPLMGLLFPTHGFMPPWSMIKFLVQLPRSNQMPVFVAATRGALRFGKVHIPGAAGFAAFFAVLVLLFKGYDIRGFFSLDMPSNFINFHSGLNPESVKLISDRSQNRLGKFLDPILSGKRKFLTLNNFYELIWSVLLFWLIPIFPILYLIYGKMFMAKIMFSNTRCDACGRCARFCPNRGVTMKRFFTQKRPYWTYHCENCLRCMGYCEKKAIETGHSWAVILFFITSVPGITFLFSRWINPIALYPVLNNQWLALLVDTLYFIPALLLSYFIFWCLTRIPMVNYLFSITTLTHYYRRYHEPGTGLKDLQKQKNNRPLN